MKSAVLKEKSPGEIRWNAKARKVVVKLTKVHANTATTRPTVAAPVLTVDFLRMSNEHPFQLPGDNCVSGKMSMREMRMS